MIVVIPMMGLGNRFAENGYSEYKPFVRVNTVPLIRLVIEPLLKMPVYVVCNYETSEQLRSLFGERIHIILHNSATRGAAETILRACPYLPPDEQISCVDCDTIFSEAAVNGAMLEQGNFLLTFLDNDRTGMYSYVKTDGYGKITEIAEKIAISNIANAGWYCFKDVDTLEEACEKTLYLNKELYLSRAVDCSIQTGEEFFIRGVSYEFNCCGTPAQLQSYARQSSTVRTICFDVDGTLVHDLYNDQRPIKKNVEYCNELYRNGHTIVLYSSRGMLSKGGDMLLIEESRPFIEEVLKKCGVLYHSLIFGKPYADLYIDDKAVSAHRNLEKECGIYMSQQHAARSHNRIVINGNKVIKTGNLAGECYYYQHIPEEIRQYFPTVISATPTEIVIEKINRPTYSSLLLSKKLTKVDAEHLVVNLFMIHNTKHPSENLDLNWGYSQKIQERFAEHRSFYEQLNITIPDINILQHREGVIHGDPVFTNAFLGGKFIDMRGQWDGENTVRGDVFYDYAKVLQSLYGYDYVLHNEPIEHEYLKSLRIHFKESLKEMEPLTDFDDLRRKVKLLFYSLLPLHKEDMNRCRFFLELIKTIE